MRYIHFLAIALLFASATASKAASGTEGQGKGSAATSSTATHKASKSKPSRAPLTTSRVGELEHFSDGSTGRILDFVSTGGVTIGAFLRKPAGKGPFPVVVMLHGGGPSDGLGLGRRTKSPTSEFVAAGWAVYSIDFRHPTVRSKATGPVLDPIEWEDTVAAIKKVRSQPDIDPKRVAIMGGSHGGNVSSRVLSRVDLSGAILCAPAALDLTEVAKAAASGQKVYSNLKKMIHDVEVKYGAKIDEIGKDPARYGFTSAITEAAKARCPILIINGRNDPASPIPVIDAYVKKLRAAGKSVDMYLPDNGPHGFYYGEPKETNPETQIAAQRAVEFLRKQFAKPSGK